MELFFESWINPLDFDHSIINFGANSMKTRIAVSLLLCMFALPLTAFASQTEKCDYQEFQRLPLFEDMHGIGGSLIIMRDRGFMNVSMVGPDTPETTCNAQLYLRDKNNKRVFKQTLEKPIASLETVQLMERPPKAFALKVDYGVGWGSYAGPITSFFDVVDGKIKWVQFRKNKSKKTEKLNLMTSLKSGWELVRAGKNFDILEAVCRPDVNGKSDEGAFTITYMRYHYNGSEWIVYSRQVKGYWDYEEFPDISLFPKAP
jgi:hypothetical protein